MPEPAPNAYIDFHVAAKHAIGRTSYTTVLGWARLGTKAGNGEVIRLKYVREGGRVYTTLAWMAEFREAIAAADCEAVIRRDRAVAVRSGKRRTVSHKTADILLTEQGL